VVPAAVTWLPVLIGLFGGLGMSEAWQLWLLAWFGQPFGVTDPQFGLDLGFYVYRLAALRQLLSSGTTILLITGGLLFGVYWYVDQVRVRGNELLFGRLLRNHVLVLVAVLMLLRAVDQWISRYSLLLAPQRLFYGAGWTATHVTMPSLALSAVLAVVAAAACLWATRPRVRARIAYWGIGLHVGVALLGTMVAPPVVQRLKVAPNEFEMERPYLERAIASTRRAFGLEQVQERSLPSSAPLSADDLARNAATVADIRIWDHRPLLRTYAQLQEIRQYYDIINVNSDRYELDGSKQQVLIAARELNHQQLDQKAKSWINLHLDYTHGYGAVVSSASRQGAEGQPLFLAKDIPPVTHPGLRIDEPRIYFGEVIAMPPEENPRQQGLLPQTQQQQRGERPEQAAARAKERYNSLRENDEADYLLVGTREEFDYGETRNGEEVKHRTTYRGQSGIPAGGFLRRLAFALRLHSVDVLVSRLVQPQTKVLLHRQVTRRCNKAAPFLLWDTHPYPVIADGRLVWICEGYTYSLSYPYSQVHFERRMTPGGPRWQPVWNYLRNPVKAVVDAYDGTVRLYVVDEADPLVQSYQRIYPGIMQPASAAAPAVRQHFRYPALLFKTQAAVYRRYHMNDPQVFYNQEDLWAVAREVDRETERLARLQNLDPKKEELYRDMEPYYITMSLPGSKDVDFLLISPFTPYSTPDERGRVTQRDNLIAWMGALCDPERYGQLVVYRFPKDTNVFGPLQVEARIDQDDAISQQITLWDKGGSRVLRGNLLVIPIESSLLYVQPLYLESEKRGLPELKRVIVGYEDRLAMEPTLEAALQRLFGRATRPVAAPATAAAPARGAAQTAAPAGGAAPLDAGAMATAREALDASEAALRAGDWAAFAKERQRLREALGKLAGQSSTAGK